MKIIGLDLAMGVTGVSFQDSTAVTIDTSKLKGDARLTFIADKVRGYTESIGADLAVIEGPGRFLGKTGHIIGMVHGVVRAELDRLGVPFVEVAPDTLKKFATGSGKADKTAMALAAYKRAGLEFPDDNACDAWWLRQAGVHWLAAEKALFPMPKAQRDALAKAIWPTLTSAQVAS